MTHITAHEKMVGKPKVNITTTNSYYYYYYYYYNSG